MAWTPRSTAATVCEPGVPAATFACSSANSSSKVFTGDDSRSPLRPRDTRAANMLPTMRRTSVSAAALLLATVAGVSACAPEDSGTDAAPAATTSGGTLACDPASLRTLTAGKLTIGTDQPAYEPWFKDDKPE